MILNLLITELQNKRIDEVLAYFTPNDISEERLIFYLSNLANQIKTVEYHEMTANIYHFHFNYIDQIH